MLLAWCAPKVVRTALHYQKRAVCLPERSKCKLLVVLDQLSPSDTLICPFPTPQPLQNLADSKLVQQQIVLGFLREFKSKPSFGSELECPTEACTVCTTVLCMPRESLSVIALQPHCRRNIPFHVKPAHMQEQGRRCSQGKVSSLRDDLLPHSHKRTYLLKWNTSNKTRLHSHFAHISSACMSSEWEWTLCLSNKLAMSWRNSTKTIPYKSCHFIHIYFVGGNIRLSTGQWMRKRSTADNSDLKRQRKYEYQVSKFILVSPGVGHMHSCVDNSHQIYSPIKMRSFLHKNKWKPRTCAVPDRNVSNGFFMQIRQRWSAQELRLWENQSNVMNLQAKNGRFFNLRFFCVWHVCEVLCWGRATCKFGCLD